MKHKNCEEAMQGYKEAYYRRDFEKKLKAKVDKEDEIAWARGFNTKVQVKGKEAEDGNNNE